MEVGDGTGAKLDTTVLSPEVHVAVLVFPNGNVVTITPVCGVTGFDTFKESEIGDDNPGIET